MLAAFSVFLSIYAFLSFLQMPDEFILNIRIFRKGATPVT